jgi:hypothetical protein
MTSHFAHPSPCLNRLTQYGAFLLMILMLLAAVGQLALALIGFPLVVLLITSAITFLLIAPVLMLTTATPAVTVGEDGITIEPVIWRARLIRWHEIAAIKPYPLLPPAEVEVGRRAFIGRRRYRPAEGVMLVIPSLPPHYRFTGLFTGEGFTGIIALTNRTHTDYGRLVALVEANSQIAL